MVVEHERQMVDNEILAGHTQIQWIEVPTNTPHQLKKCRENEAHSKAMCWDARLANRIPLTHLQELVAQDIKLLLGDV